MATDHFIAWMTRIQQETEVTLAACLPGEPADEQALPRAMRYAALMGGKRIRPLLVFAAGELVDARPQALMRIGAAIELIHCYSLVHDDLPCMDNDVLRRGKPTCHIAFGEAIALLTGDALQTQAFELLATPLEGIAPARQLAMLKILAHASGSVGMAGGQAIDLASVGKTLSLPELEYMHLLKTGALIRAAILLGAEAGSPLAPTLADRLDHFAKCIGLLFQVVDDLLDYASDTQTLGKTAGKDQLHDKPTYVSLMGYSEAKRFAHELKQDAFSALSDFGERAERIKQLANYIVERSF